MNITKKLIHSHLLKGDMVVGQEIAIRIDPTLTQDATGTLVMLELEDMGLDRVKTEVSVQYVIVRHQNACGARDFRLFLTVAILLELLDVCTSRRNAALDAVQ